MKRLLFFMVAMLMCVGVYAQTDDPFKDEDLTSKHVGIGTTGGGGANSLSATLIVPFETDKWNLWIGGFMQQVTEGSELHSQTINLHVEPEYKVTPRVSINAYGDALRDHVREINGQVQFGGFVTYDFVETDDVGVKIGVGNYLQNRQVQEDLEREATDPTTVHLLGYAKTRYKMVSNTFRFTPKLDMSNPAFELKPKATFAVSKDWALTVGGIVGYEQEAAEQVYWSYQIQGTYSF